ncbi:B12-binding domain-containing protein [Streptomyces sp. S1D4-11]
MLEEMYRLTSAGVPPAEAARTAQEGVGRLQPGPEPPGGGDLPGGHRSQAAGALPLGDVRQECRGLARAAVRLDAPTVGDQLAALVARYGVVLAWDEVMVPTLHAVGRKWESSGDRYVEVEHRLSWHISRALHRAIEPVRPVGTPAAAAGRWCWRASRANSTAWPWRRCTRDSSNSACPLGCSGRRSPRRR